jgi:hypothetical protein
MNNARSRGLQSVQRRPRAPTRPLATTTTHTRDDNALTVVTRPAQHFLNASGATLGSFSVCGFAKKYCCATLRRVALVERHPRWSNVTAS